MPGKIINVAFFGLLTCVVAVETVSGHDANGMSWTAALLQGGRIAVVLGAGYLLLGVGWRLVRGAPLLSEEFRSNRCRRRIETRFPGTYAVRLQSGNWLAIEIATGKPYCELDRAGKSVLGTIHDTP